MEATTNKNLRQVRPEDFDTTLLLQAAREGRLFIMPATGPEPERCRQTDRILRYVEAIAGYATTTRVGGIWEEILHHGQLAPLFFFSRYSSSRGQVNWYRVTAVVCLLRELGVYRQDIPAVRLHCILEGTTRRTGRYTGMNRYLLDHPETSIVRRIVEKYDK